jgi:hypothetical protein
MTDQTVFAATCSEYAATIERITRLETLAQRMVDAAPQGYWSEDHQYELDDLVKRRETLKQQLKAMLEVEP